jgi:hypothetical protein
MMAQAVHLGANQRLLKSYAGSRAVLAAIFPTR